MWTSRLYVLSTFLSTPPGSGASVDGEPASRLAESRVHTFGERFVHGVGALVGGSTVANIVSAELAG